MVKKNLEKGTKLWYISENNEPVECTVKAYKEHAVDIWYYSVMPSCGLSCISVWPEELFDSKASASAYAAERFNERKSDLLKSITNKTELLQMMLRYIEVPEAEAAAKEKIKEYFGMDL